jgi:hypothetical protein
MTALDRILPAPHRVERDSIDLALTPSRAWELLRHDDLGRHSFLIRALFGLRTLPSRLVGNQPAEVSLSLDALASSPAHPGFQVLAETAPSEIVVGAIGKFWHLDIPFVHVADAEAFTAFSAPGFARVAWAIQISPLGRDDSRVELEVRIDATDAAAWKKLRRYFAIIGPASRFIRHTLLGSLAREHGTPESKREERPLPGDELLPDATLQSTHSVTIARGPEAIWPWLVQMGCRRAGFYSIDLFDNDAIPSAREIHPDLQSLRVGDVVAATRRGHDGFEVLRIDPGRALILGGLFDPVAKKQLRFDAPRPESFWQVTWAFTLEPLDGVSTRLLARARATCSKNGGFHVAWIRPVHHLMQTAQLHHLAARVEESLSRDTWRDVAAGVGGAAIMTAAMLTPFLRAGRNHWGVDGATAALPHPSDELVPDPRWSWTHGIEIDAAPERVWPWIAQVGVGRGGFYSYQWLENVAGCEVSNAESVHPDWAVHTGEKLVLHPKSPPLTVVSVIPGRYFVAYARGEPSEPKASGPWVETSWLFWVEPLPNGRTRLISRYRCACSDDLATRLMMGPTFLEPIGFVMDRRMLRGVKERVERAEELAKSETIARTTTDC